jgi:NTP pyrophosphatase (non-canonical NTP hydrolase)
LDFATYQAQTPSTAKLDITETPGKVELVLGLVSEVGSLAAAYKRLLRDALSLDAQRERLSQDLGDVLWYIAMIANSLKLDLSQVAADNLVRTRDRYEQTSTTPAAYRPPFEDGFPETQVFPRRMLFRMEELDGEAENGTLPHVSFKIIDAKPYAFKDGRPVVNGRPLGFDLGQELGDKVNDNASTEDGYRYHDAVHVAFMAVLGWSPVMRGLLRLKRKKDGEVDRVQDGARARDLEEALSAILKEYSRSRNDFENLADIDGDVRDLIRRVIVNLEVGRVPIWLWARAIHQGYAAMNALHANKGGWVIADLDEQSVTFSATRPAF